MVAFGLYLKYEISASISAIQNKVFILPYIAHFFFHNQVFNAQRGCIRVIIVDYHIICYCVSLK